MNTERTPITDLIAQNEIESNGTDNARTYSKDISRERQKETGEIFTPLFLVDEMINRLGKDALSVDFTIFEPAAGDGNFVARIIERKIDLVLANLTTAQKDIWLQDLCERVVTSVYCCEYMKDNVATIKTRILELVQSYGTIDIKPIRRILARNVAYCNTVDAWDTTEGRKYPDWLIRAMGGKDSDQYLSMRAKSKHYKKASK